MSTLKIKMETKSLRVRKYMHLRRKGYTAWQALWNVRACSDYFWEKQLFPERNSAMIVGER